MLQKSFADRFHLFVVCDGHGGPQCAGFTAAFFQREVVFQLESKLVKNTKSIHVATLLQRAVAATVEAWDRECCFGSDVLSHLPSAEKRDSVFRKINYPEYVAQGFESGTTLCSFLVDTRTAKTYTVNLGDSRCVVQHECELSESMDHSVNTLTSLGFPIPGFPESCVLDGRVCGDLGMTHSVGDNTNKLSGVVQRTPAVTCSALKAGVVRVILGTDGFFDAFKNYTRVFQFVPKVTARALCAKQIFDDNAAVFFVQVEQQPYQRA